MKKEITYDELDAMCERFEKAEYKCEAWWPTMQDVKENIEPNIKNALEFVIWITETANPPQTEDEILVRKHLLKLINDNLKIKKITPQAEVQ